MVIGYLVIVRVFDERLARKVTERFEIVLAVMENTTVRFQRLHSDHPAAGGLNSHLQTAAAMPLIGGVGAVVDTIAHANLFDALAVGTAEVDIRMEIVRASGALGQVGRDERGAFCVTSRLVRVISAIVGTIAAASLEDARPIETPESVLVALPWAQVLLMQVANMGAACVLEAWGLDL